MVSLNSLFVYLSSYGAEMGEKVQITVYQISSISYFVVSNRAVGRESNMFFFSLWKTRHLLENKLAQPQNEAKENLVNLNAFVLISAEVRVKDEVRKDKRLTIKLGS